MEKNLRELLDKVYELEGLVILALNRQDDAEKFLSLIGNKGTEVKNLCEALSGKPDIITEKRNQSLGNQLDFQEYTIDEFSDKPPFTEKIEEKETQPPVVTSDHKKGKLIFSINERFRFRRELFENSDVDFNNTMALVASMDDYEEAEDFFINEEGFDKNNPVVKEFLNIIKNYFK